jgi:hypothetical protein
MNILDWNRLSNFHGKARWLLTCLKKSWFSSDPGKIPLLGDALVIAGTVCYAFNNVGQVSYALHTFAAIMWISTIFSHIYSFFNLIFSQISNKRAYFLVCAGILCQEQRSSWNCCDAWTLWVASQCSSDVSSS